MELKSLKIKKFIPVFLILGFVLIIFFLVSPTYNEVKHLGSLIEIKQAALENQEQQNQLIQELKASKELEKLDQVLPDDPEVPELMIQLETMASQNNLILKSINFSENQGEIAAQVILAGSYQAFKNYLKAVENNLRLMDVVNLDFQAPKDSSLYDFNLTIKAYYGSYRQESKNTID